MKLVIGSIGLLTAMFLALGDSTVSGQPPAKNKTATVQPKATDKAPDKTEAATTFEVYKDNSGKFRFRMKAGDVLLATSGKGYDEKSDCMKVIKHIQSDAAKAKIDDQAK